LSKTESQLKIRLLQSMPQLYDKHGHKMSVHFRINHVTKEFEVIINRSCNKCKNFKDILGETKLICIKCKYQKDWLSDGKR